MDEKPICVNCVNYIPFESKPNSEYDKCAYYHIKEINLVTGKEEYVYCKLSWCEQARANEHACGKNGIHYKRKPEVEITTDNNGNFITEMWMWFKEKFNVRK